MKSLRLFLALTFIFNIVIAQTQTINQEKSVVEFKIGAMGFGKTKGTFKNMKGDFSFNATALNNSNFNVCVDASTVNTKNDKRDKHLKNEDFFNVDVYPKICFESTSITKLNDTYITKGNLILHGITKEVEIPFNFKNNTFTGTIEINRLDYGLGEGTGTFMVSDKVKITITCVIE